MQEKYVKIKARLNLKLKAFKMGFLEQNGQGWISIYRCKRHTDKRDKAGCETKGVRWVRMNVEVRLGFYLKLKGVRWV